jgi:hypothetical protein
MNPKYLQINSTSIEERGIPGVFTFWVLRCSADRSDFNGRNFDASMIVEQIPSDPTGLYIGVASSHFHGGIRRMTVDTRAWFKAQGFTHAKYIIDGHDGSREL